MPTAPSHQLSAIAVYCDLSGSSQLPGKEGLLSGSDSVVGAKKRGMPCRQREKEIERVNVEE